MQPVDYDVVAPAYDERYESNRYDGIHATLNHFLGDAQELDVVEIGCGTGHWLAAIGDKCRTLTGLDLSWEMLGRARVATQALLIRASAGALPLSNASVDRVFCIHALHHFPDKYEFARQTRRVLRPGGGLLTVGLDPHTRTDQWWVYDYFPAALEADRQRYQATGTIRAMLREAGFTNVTTELAQHIPGVVPFADAVDRGILDRRATSQLMVITDAEFDAGMKRLHAEQPVLRADLRLFATIGWCP